MHNKTRHFVLTVKSHMKIKRLYIESVFNVNEEIRCKTYQRFMAIKISKWSKRTNKKAIAPAQRWCN